MSKKTTNPSSLKSQFSRSSAPDLSRRELLAGAGAGAK